MLDAIGLSARNCRQRLGLAHVTAYLSERFPEHRDACREILERETARLIEELRTLGEWAKRVSDRADADEEIGDGESFLRYRAGDPLSPTQTEALRLLGSQLRSVWDEWRGGMIDHVRSDREARHRLLIRAIDHHQLASTERGWSWIDAEQDCHCLDLLLLLATKPDCGQFLTNLKRGLLEHRALCSRLLDETRSSP